MQVNGRRIFALLNILCRTSAQYADLLFKLLEESDETITELNNIPEALLARVEIIDNADSIH